MAIAETLRQDMKAAMRSGEKLETGALRMALAAIKTREIEVQRTLDDADVVAVLERLIKQGRDSEQQFRSAGRAELAAKESAEIAVFERYMPQALSPAETDALIREAVAEAGATDIKGMGKVMAIVKAKAAGRVDMGAVSARVREILAGG